MKSCLIKRERGRERERERERERDRETDRQTEEGGVEKDIFSQPNAKDVYLFML